MQAFVQLASQQRGRPRQGPPSELDRERGRRITAWIRSGVGPPHMPLELRNADIARMTGVSPSAIQYLMNDCYDATEDRMKLPTDKTLEKLANGLRLKLSDGMAARYHTPPVPTEKFTGKSRTVTTTANDEALAFAESYTNYTTDEAKEIIRKALEYADQVERGAIIGGTRTN